jgi:hypothetical protein
VPTIPGRLIRNESGGDRPREARARRMEFQLTFGQCRPCNGRGRRQNETRRRSWHRKGSIRNIWPSADTTAAAASLDRWITSAANTAPGRAVPRSAERCRADHEKAHRLRLRASGMQPRKVSTHVDEGARPSSRFPLLTMCGPLDRLQPRRHFSCTVCPPDSDYDADHRHQRGGRPVPMAMA